MANQIAHFFASQPHDAAVQGMANHLTKFWNPHMRNELIRNVDEKGGAGLDALALEVVRKLHVGPVS